MATINLSLLANQVRHLEGLGMSRQEAEERAFAENGFTQDQLSQEVMAEFERLYSGEATQTQLNGDMQGDKDRILDRRNVGTSETYDLDPQTPTTTNEPTE